MFHGTVGVYSKRAREFIEYAKAHNFFPTFDNKLDFDISNPTRQTKKLPAGL